MLSFIKNKIFILSILFLALSCKKNNLNNDNSSGLRDTILVNEFYNMISKPNTVILDVRTPEEFNSGHVENAMNINFYDSVNFESNIKRLDKNLIYLIYCRTDNRSGKTFNLMKENNFNNIYILKGGITAIRENGKPLSIDSTR